MQLKAKQKADLVSIEYFIPRIMKHIEITDEDRLMFLENSEQGKHKELVDTYKMDGFNALIQGKRWRGIHIHELYEPGTIDCTMPYYTILGGNEILVKRRWWQFWKPKYTFRHLPIPREVVDFLKKEMFQGMDSDLIEKTYQDILYAR